MKSIAILNIGLVWFNLNSELKNFILQIINIPLNTFLNKQFKKNLFYASDEVCATYDY